MMIVVDIGNSRMKWGRCSDTAVVEWTALPLYEIAPWDEQCRQWRTEAATRWVLAASNQLALERFQAWLTVRDQSFRVLAEASDFPIPHRLEQPESVGKDRLATALAYRELRQGDSRRPGILVSAGTAFTVDYVDEAGWFVGGAILPGFSMQAEALNYYTTRLPLVELPAELPTGPGRHTVAALQAGIVAGGVGAVRYLREQYSRLGQTPAQLVLTGGAAVFLAQAFPDAEVWSEMTLEGLRLAAATER